MSNTYTQLHVQFIFAVQYRAALIGPAWKDRLHQYLTGIFRNNEHKMLQINSMPDLIHLLIGLRPDRSISSLMQLVKSESTKWINDHHLAQEQFAWQSGYGAFSYSKSDLPQVIAYIKNQEDHHQKQPFPDEYRGFLKAFKIEYDEPYIFKPPI